MPKRNIYVSQGLSDLIDAHDSAVPLSQILAAAVQQHIGTKVCPACDQPVRVAAAVQAARSRTSDQAPVRSARKVHTAPKSAAKGVRVVGKRRSAAR